MAERTLQDLIDNLAKFERELFTEAKYILLRAGGKFVKDKKEEIAKTGVGRYSNKLHYASSFKGKELTGAGKTFLENKTLKKQKTNWAGLRKAEGLQIAHVDLWYSGAMIKSTDATEAEQFGHKYWIHVGSKDDEGKKKLFFNYKRYGNFLFPNARQKNEMRKSVFNETRNLLIKNIR